MVRNEANQRQLAQIVMKNEPGVQSPSHAVRQNRLQHRIPRRHPSLHRPDAETGPDARDLSSLAIGAQAQPRARDKATERIECGILHCIWVDGTVFEWGKEVPV